jgi:alpha-mannosidase
MQRENDKNNLNIEKKEKIQCHFISNTHWDREWRYSAQRTRHMLCYMMNMLLDILEKEPRFQSFHLDSQTVPLLDYLEIYPEKEEIIRKHIQEGRLVVGPWFCLPDEFLIGGESLIRNLLLGHKIAARFGEVSKTGYSPFSWGQISQMPQIYKGFGIDMISFYRGINTLVAPRSEFVWEGSDGTRIYASRLSVRPRYNVWYVIQRPVYWNEQNEGNRYMKWEREFGPFHFVNMENKDMDYQYTHPKFRYHGENIAERAKQAIEEQNKDWSTPHRFWSCGHDSSCPDIREAQMIEDCNDVLEDAEVFHSTVKAWQDGVIANYSEDWPVLYGEMRHPYTAGSASDLIGWVTSSRTYIKQANFKAERELTYYAEPMSVFASLLGAPHPQKFIDTAYYWLLLNHGHDSIAGCGRDVLADDVIYRLRQSSEISNCIMERAMLDIVGSIDLSAWSPKEMAIVTYNPASFTRDEVLEVFINIPNEWECQSFEIVDEDGELVTTQILDVNASCQAVQIPNDTANLFLSKQYHIFADLKDIPGLGYKTYKVKPLYWKRTKSVQPKSMLSGPQTMENEYLSVTINSNGTLNIRDKISGKQYQNMGYFRDSSETGDPWKHIPVPNERIFTTLNERAEICLIRDGELEASFQVKINWRLPEDVTLNQNARSHMMKTYPIINTVTLRKGQRYVDIVTELDNTVKNHYLQVSFPSDIKADKIYAQGQFDIVERSIIKPNYTQYEEDPITENPMNSFVDINDGEVGMALLNEGLKGYEAHDDFNRTVSISLLRSYVLKICVTVNDVIDYGQTDPGTQCLGKHTFHYGVMPHENSCEEAGIWQAAESFNLKLLAGQTGPTRCGKEPLRKSFLELSEEKLHVSAVKQSEKGDGWVVRLFNPFQNTIKASMRLNGGFSGPKKVQSPVERVENEFELPKTEENRWNKVTIVSLEEIPISDLQIKEDGWVDFEISNKKILTIVFRS